MVKLPAAIAIISASRGAGVVGALGLHAPSRNALKTSAPLEAMIGLTLELPAADLHRVALAAGIDRVHDAVFDLLALGALLGHDLLVLGVALLGGGRARRVDACRLALHARVATR